MSRDKPTLSISHCIYKFKSVHYTILGEHNLNKRDTTTMRRIKKLLCGAYTFESRTPPLSLLLLMLLVGKPYTRNKDSCNEERATPIADGAQICALGANDWNG